MYSRNHVMAAIENDRQYNIQKRKLVKRDENLRKIPTEPGHFDNRPILKHPTFKSFINNQKPFNDMPQVKLPPPSEPMLLKFRQTRHKSRCSSASSRSSIYLKSQYNQMQRIRKDNEKMVERILLAKPTLPSKKQNKQFYDRHQEISKRLSRYSFSSITRRRVNDPYVSVRPPQKGKSSSRDIILPQLKHKRLSVKQYYSREYLPMEPQKRTHKNHNISML